MITQSTTLPSKPTPVQKQLHDQFMGQGKKSQRAEKERTQSRLVQENNQLNLQQHKQKTLGEEQEERILFKQDSTSLSFQQNSTTHNLQSQIKDSENIQKIKLNDSKFIKEKAKSNRRLKNIEQQKRQVVQELKKLDEEILEIKNRNKSLSKQRKIQKERLQQQALKNAKSLVHYYKLQKKLSIQRRNQERNKSIEELKQQQQTFRKVYLIEAKQALQQKRRVISMKIQENKKKQEQLTMINHQRNKVVSKLIKQEELLKQRERLPQYLAELEQQRASLYQRKEQINIREIQQHQRKYIELKQLQKSQVVSRKSASLNFPVPKFKKNVWAQRLENEQYRKREQEKSKDIKKKINLQNKMKYSELVKNIFIPKRKQRMLTEGQTFKKRGTPDLFNHNNSVNLPAISQSDKSINQTKIMKRFRQNAKERLDTSFQSLHQPQSQRKIVTQFSEQKTQEEKKRIERLMQLKKETEERLKKMDQKRLQMLLQSQKKQKSKYKNYLGSLKLKRKSNPKDWKKIIDSTKLTNQQKYAQMMKKAVELQQQAKKNQYKQKEGKEISVQFYINSIQAKLALLQKF